MLVSMFISFWEVEKGWRLTGGCIKQANNRKTTHSSVVRFFLIYQMHVMYNSQVPYNGISQKENKQTFKASVVLSLGTLPHTEGLNINEHRICAATESTGSHY